MKSSHRLGYLVMKLFSARLQLAVGIVFLSRFVAVLALVAIGYQVYQFSIQVVTRFRLAALKLFAVSYQLARMPSYQLVHTPSYQLVRTLAFFC
jgi:hypothetical protein